MGSNATVPIFAQGLRVMLVDFEVTNLTYMKILLQLNGYRVTMMKAAGPALSMLLKQPRDFDIVIVDAAMPEIDGFNFLQQIRLKDDIPVILMAANVRKGMVSTALTLGASCLLKKPIPADDLIRVWHHVFYKRAGNPSSSVIVPIQASQSPYLSSIVPSSSAMLVQASSSRMPVQNNNSSVLMPSSMGFTSPPAQVMLIPAWHSPYLSNVHDTSLVMPQLNNGQPRWASPYISDNMGFQKTSPAMPTQGLIIGNNSLNSAYLSNSIRSQNPYPEMRPIDFSHGQRGWNSPYLPVSMVGENTSLAMPAQQVSLGKRPRNTPYFSKTIGGENTTFVTPAKGFVHLLNPSNAQGSSNNVGGPEANIGTFSYMLQRPWSSSASSNSMGVSSNDMGGPNAKVGSFSCMPMENYSDGQQQRPWGSSTFPNSMGGLTTNVNNSWTTRIQNVNYGQYQRLERSPYLSSYMGGLNVNTGNSVMVPAQNLQNGQSQKPWDSSSLLPMQSFSSAPRPGFFDLENLAKRRADLSHYTSVCIPQLEEGYTGGYLSSSFLKPPETGNSANNCHGQSGQADVAVEHLAEENAQNESAPHHQCVQLAEGVEGGNLVEQSTIGSKRFTAAEQGKGILMSDSSDEGSVDPDVDLNSRLPDIRQELTTEGVEKGNLVEESTIGSTRLTASEKGKGILISDSSEEDWIDFFVDLNSGLLDSLQGLTSDGYATAIADPAECMMEKNNSLDFNGVPDCKKGENDPQGLQDQEFSAANWEGLALDTSIMKEDFIMGQEGSSENPNGLNYVNMEPLSMEVPDVPYAIEGSVLPNTIEASGVPYISEGSNVPNKEPYTMEGSDGPNKRAKTMDGSYVINPEPKSMDRSNVPNEEPKSGEGPDAPSCSKPQEQGFWSFKKSMDFLCDDNIPQFMG